MVCSSNLLKSEPARTEEETSLQPVLNSVSIPAAPIQYPQLHVNWRLIFFFFFFFQTAMMLMLDFDPRITNTQVYEK